MRTIRDHVNGIDRYHFDFGACSIDKGFAQVDTKQDASYYGTWANPTRRIILSYAEGDVCMQICDTGEEFAQTMRELAKFHDEHGWGPLRIDPGFSTEIKSAFEALGLGDLLH